MAVLNGALENVLGNPIALAVISVLFVVLLGGYVFNQRRGSCGLLPVPKVPGVPLLGNLLQLKEKKPYKTFTKWAEIHGPIYSIQLGSSYMIVLNSTEVAKEAMVTRFPSISTRKLSNALTILTHDKRMVATSDYNEFHKTVKRLVVTHLLGSNAQKRNKHLRETMVQHMVDNFSAHAKKNPLQAVNFREIFQYENFGLGLKQAIGRDVQSLYVKELGTTLSRKDIFHVLVLDMMEGAIEVDWRDFFPYLRWVPNKKMETKIKSLDFRRQAVIEALIREHKDQTHARETISCYLDSLLSEENILSHSEVTMLLWEPIIETSDTTLITTEWAMFELAKNPDRQDRLYQEIQEVCGSEEITEEHLLQIPYLGAIFHETLRKHSPVPIIPIRYVHEDTRIGGFHVPAGSEICINLYGCNMDKTQWDNPEDWNPERFLETKYDPQDLYKTMAFGAGKRICAGSLQAMSVACLSIGRFVQEFEWRLPPGVEEDVDTVGLTSHKLHPLHAIAKPRH